MIKCDFQRVGSMSSTENYFISPIVIRVNASTIKSFQTSLWVHCSLVRTAPKVPLKCRRFSRRLKKARARLLPSNLFCKPAYISWERDAALVFCDIFKTQVECLTYVAAGGWVAPPPPPTSPQKGCWRAKTPGARKKPRFSAFCTTAKLSTAASFGRLFVFSQQMSKHDLNRST